jgi:L-ascorbate metabolism protein UlaG (beta-lactamase superfamily)
VVLVSDKMTRIAIDPYLSDSVPLTRIAPVVCLPEDLEVDHVFLSHDHSDHTDPNTCIPLMRSRRVQFWGPASSMNVLRGAGARPDRLNRIDRGSTVQLGDVTVQAVHAQHTEDSVGYVVSLSGKSVYHTGDTEISEELFWLHSRSIDVMLACFSGRWEAMNATQAANLAEALHVDVTIPIHHDMFAENRADPETLVSAIKGRPASGARVEVLAPGDRWVYP